MSDLTPEDILDDFTRELKYLPKTHRRKFYVEIRDKAKAQLAKCSSSQKEDRPDRVKLAQKLFRMEYKNDQYTWANIGEWKREAFLIKADQIIAIFGEEGIRKDAFLGGFKAGIKLTNQERNGCLYKYAGVSLADKLYQEWQALKDGKCE